MLSFSDLGKKALLPPAGPPVSCSYLIEVLFKTGSLQTLGLDHWKNRYTYNEAEEVGLWRSAFPFLIY